MADQDPGTVVEFVSRIDADTLLVRARLVVGKEVGDFAAEVKRGDPDFERYERMLKP